MNFTIKTLRPRNPLVALARNRRAGAHRASSKTGRQAARRTLRHELSRTDDLHRSP